MLFFTVLTATYNSEKTLEHTFRSILRQTYQESFEYIVVDGASKDGTVKMIKRYESEFKQRNIVFKWISEPDRGIYDAWNKGLKLVSGKYVSFLGSDDRYLPHALKTFKKIIEEHPKYHHYCSKVRLTKNFEPISDYSVKYCRLNGLIKTVPHTGSFHSIELFDSVGHFDDNYKIAGDYELLLRLKKNLKLYSFNEVMVEMETGGISINPSYLKKGLIEVKRARINTAKFSKIYANFLFFYALYRTKYLMVFKRIMGERKYKRLTNFLKKNSA